MEGDQGGVNGASGARPEMFGDNPQHKQPLGAMLGLKFSLQWALICSVTAESYAVWLSSVYGSV